jgi:hypothetical protein
MAHCQHLLYNVIYSYIQMVITTIANNQTGILFYKMLLHNAS